MDLIKLWDISKQIVEWSLKKEKLVVIYVIPKDCFQSCIFEVKLQMCRVYK